MGDVLDMDFSMKGWIGRKERIEDGYFLEMDKMRKLLNVFVTVRKEEQSGSYSSVCNSLAPTNQSSMHPWRLANGHRFIDHRS